MASDDDSHAMIEKLQPSKEDYAEIADLYIASRADALPTVKSPHENADVRRWVKETMLQKGHTWIARRDGKIVGFLNLVGEDLNQLYLLPGYYRQGIGSLLLAKAKEASPAELHCYTFQVNTVARAFYEMNGFRAVLFADGALNEEKEPDIFYEWIGQREKREE